MWHDIETDDDYLNFGMMVNSVYDTIVEQYDDAPLSFGISGSWGVNHHLPSNSKRNLKEIVVIFSVISMLGYIKDSRILRLHFLQL